MQITGRWVGVATAVGLAALGVPTQSAAAATTRSVEVAPSMVVSWNPSCGISPFATSFDVTGHGYRPGVSAIARIGSVKSFAFPGRADASGQLAGTFDIGQVPAGAPYTVTVTGSDGGSASTALTVEASGCNRDVTQQGGRVTSTVSAAGFTPNEAVTATIDDTTVNIGRTDAVGSLTKLVLHFNCPARGSYILGLTGTSQTQTFRKQPCSPGS